ncbi:hypothetical protein TRIUR3_35144 [Triticum urartu]|uniref:Uncharacterized protein n=1 Tax=Triticum urartu TaxID=4572 RepID=M7ZQ90_TRIUA|nr:hypothetical protein TRIUR3_35144 [Triticum urartu]
MAVQAQHLSHAFSHDLHAYSSVGALEDEMTGGSLFFPENLKRGPELEGAGNTVFGDVPRVDPTWHDNTTRSHGFAQRKRARVVPEAPSYLENQRGQGLVPVGDVLTRAVGSGTASTSGRMINAAGPPQDLLSQLYRQGMEIDAVLRLEARRMEVQENLYLVRYTLAFTSSGRGSMDPQVGYLSQHRRDWSLMTMPPEQGHRCLYAAIAVECPRSRYSVPAVRARMHAAPWRK